jgi:hypothetical protein
MTKYGAFLFLLCAITSFLSREYTSTSLWVCLFLLELTDRNENSNQEGQSEDGSDKENK